MTGAPPAFLAARPMPGGLGDALATPPGRDLRIFWLGQAGFVIEACGTRVVIDPYLSDSLARKYHASATPHDRMMPPPVAPEALGAVDAVLVTHRHGDHMDAGTLAPLMCAAPGAMLVAPAAEAEEALRRAAIGPARLIGMAGRDGVDLAPTCHVTAIPAAHETLETDAAGNHRFLGYLLRLGGWRIWHSGDCVPYPGLVEAVAGHRPQVALLPTNGRSERLERLAIAGNFHLAEAVAIARAAGCRAMIGHHHGMFAFNTIDPGTIDALAATRTELQLIRAQTGLFWTPADATGSEDPA